MTEARYFSTGATRDTDQGKLDYEAFLSPIVLRRYGEYMHEHRMQSDGELRDGDNWQKGMPRDQYMKSGFRHFMDWWTFHRLEEEDHVVIVDEDRQFVHPRVEIGRQLGSAGPRHAPRLAPRVEVQGHDGVLIAEEDPA